MKKTIYTAIIVILLSACNTPPHDEIGAEIEVQYYVESILRSPSTAEFGCEESTKTGKNTYHVSGCVDAQNGFGATIRKYYECDIEYTSNGEKYRISNFVIE